MKYFLVLTLMMGWATSVADGAERVYTWAVVPQFTSFEVHRNWTPVLRYLSEKTGIQLRLNIYNNITTFERSVFQGKPDFAYMSPYHLVLTQKAHPYLPLVCDGSEKLKGILVARKDSPYKTIKDLDGKPIAFPSPNAFAASLYMRALLVEKEGLNFPCLYRHPQ